MTCTYLAKRLRELSSTKTGSYPHEFLCRTNCSACADYQPWYRDFYFLTKLSTSFSVSQSMRFEWIWFLVFSTTFRYISAISWLQVLVVEEATVPGENHRPWASNWLVRDSSAVRRLFSTCCSRGTSESSTYGKQQICPPTLGQHISTFHGYLILFSIRNPYINRFTNHFSIHSYPSYPQKVVLLHYSTIFP